MAITEDQVREALKQVVDPELFVNIVDLGLIYVVTIDENGPDVQEAEPAADAESAEAAPVEGAKVTIEMTMTSPACPAAPQIVAQSKDVVSRIEGVADAEIKLVMTPPWTPDRMTEDARDQLGIF